MINSMTGFGRGLYEENLIGFTVEMKSVNHRYLDLNIRLPKNLMSLEEKIRKVVNSSIARGKIDIFITQTSKDNETYEATLNTNLANSYYKCLEQIRENFKAKDDISVCNIARFPEIIQLNQNEEDLEEIWNVLKVALQDALTSLINARKSEGERLSKDILLKCDTLKKLIVLVENRSLNVVSDYNEKLKSRLKELVNDISIDESRIALEVAIMADKMCIDEEIVRLKGHIEHLEETLDLPEAVGRKLDFLLQEMNREANTMASKSSDLEITNVVLNIKNEIEKIREQIQNVE